MHHFRLISYSWDVVNEVLNDDGSMRSSVFYNTMGTDFINVAFNAARSADPNTKLYINDYNIEGSGSKSSAMVNLVQSLKSAGVPIEGVGLQGHFIVGSLPSDIAGTIQAYANLGVEVAITELDIRMTLPADDQKLQQQATDYQTVIEACRSVQACVGVTVWDFTDKYSWVPDTFPGQGAACPWDENLNKKPAYDGILAGWSA
ncbi:endo-1,4-beta xylanase [Sanghuangporus baumii]|uniref:Beta-xylanase n=1 Tax=Sanghuangporus baumii TaxID=108892 RepID=A0A9Q5HZ98_SANBA|nr:endo-1,4-beta xylanase [Sanghuangporus baumii]